MRPAQAGSAGEVPLPATPNTARRCGRSGVLASSRPGPRRPRCAEESGGAVSRVRSISRSRRRSIDGAHRSTGVVQLGGHLLDRHPGPSADRRVRLRPGGRLRGQAGRRHREADRDLPRERSPDLDAGLDSSRIRPAARTTKRPPLVDEARVLPGEAELAELIPRPARRRAPRTAGEASGEIADRSARMGRA